MLSDTMLCGPYPLFSSAPLLLIKARCQRDISPPYTISEQIRVVLAVVRVRSIGKVQAEYLTTPPWAYLEANNRHHIENIVIRVSLASVIVKHPFAGCYIISMVAYDPKDLP